MLEDGKGIGGKGRLTNARIDTIQNFHERRIGDNKGDVPKMSAEVWTIGSTTTVVPFKIHYTMTVQGSIISGNIYLSTTKKSFCRSSCQSCSPHFQLP